ncbi:MAG: polysaccharide deacetylase family protein, partial [Elusimicrobiota bacterium]
LSLGELVDRLLKKKVMPPGCAALTFDDGYENNYRVAFPLLKKFNVPATIFIATDFVKNKKLLWVDRVEIAFARTTANEFSCPMTRRVYPLGDLKETARAYLETKAALKRADTGQREQAVAEITRRLLPGGPTDPDPDYAPLTRAQLREMIRSGLVEIGAHSVRHAILTRLDLSEARWEIEESAKDVEDLAGKRPRFFAYPNGAYGAAVADLVRLAGYEAAFAVGLRLNQPEDLRLFSIKRVALAQGDTPALFAATLCGLRGALTSAREVLRG